MALSGYSANSVHVASCLLLFNRIQAVGHEVTLGTLCFLSALDARTFCRQQVLLLWE